MTAVSAPNCERIYIQQICRSECFGVRDCVQRIGLRDLGFTHISQLIDAATVIALTYCERIRKSRRARVAWNVCGLSGFFVAESLDCLYQTDVVCFDKI